ncbi:MAG: 50S ribosome-binding GTPase [Firmicutes bacterium]|nr:50S ribosome-binding GTPase [Bacillota bacterium]
MDSSQLQTALEECTRYANTGYRLAEDGVNELKKAVSTASEQIRDSLMQLGKSKVNTPNARDVLKTQLSDISLKLKNLSSQVEDDIQQLKDSMSSFSVTLFGRTMAGKSTLMEILTHGNGASIGKGSQRTTRDVRPYCWNGLRITDVPGIAAFEGEEDETTAFEAAKTADLILFLVTDDAPQAAEAECLAKVRNLGKPVLGIINVKVDIDTTKSYKLMLRDIAKRFDFKRLDGIKAQFFAFAIQYGQDWHDIRFAYVHLKSAYLSQQPECNEYAQALAELSKFEYVEQFITQEVITRGKFYRVKTFVDSVGKPLLDTMEKLLWQSAQNSEQGRLLLNKRRALSDWTKKFKDDGIIQIDSMLTKIRSTLISEIASFAEDNYDNPNANRKWDAVLKPKNIEGRCDKLIKKLASDCDDGLREITREINQEISFSAAVFADKSINMSSLIDGKRIWSWVSTIAGGGVGIATILGLITGPVGWFATTGVVLIGFFGSFFFKSRENKAMDARRKLEGKLNDHIDKTIRSLRKQMLDILYNELLKKRLYGVANDINAVIDSLFKLSEAQKDLGWRLNRKLKEINKMLIIEALSFVGAGGLDWHVRDLARIPGNAIMIMLDDGKRFPDDIRRNLSVLLKEQVWFVFYNDNPKILLSRAIGRGCAKDNISIEYKLKIAHVPLNKLNALTVNRVRLAQQLTELLITK